MKNKLSTFLIIVSLTSLVGFTTGDEVELDSFLSGRTSPSFYKYSKNRATTLSKGTTGEVLEIKKFSKTGNSGIKMKITNGPKSGKSYWVYYNKKSPAIKLTNKKNKQDIIPDEVKVDSEGQPEEDILANTTSDVNSIRGIQEHAIEQTTKMVVDTLELDVVNHMMSNDDPACESTSSTNVETPINLENFDETLTQPPLRQSNQESLDNNPFKCITRNHLLWSTCYNIGTKDVFVPRSFNFTNEGGNKTVPKSTEANRKYSFEFQGAALSDMSLLIWDSPSFKNSQGHLKLMTFFPRDVMPAIRQSDTDEDILVVTLPTREEVLFNGKTKEIVSGALKEGPMKQASGGAAISPDVQYTGSGVVVEASARGDFPVGFEGKNSDNHKTVTIKKKGEKTCSVPEKDLWYTDKSKGSNSFFNKDLYTNEAFDNYVKKKCNFSIY